MLLYIRGSRNLGAPLAEKDELCISGSSLHPSLFRFPKLSSEIVPISNPHFKHSNIYVCMHVPSYMYHPTSATVSLRVDKSFLFHFGLSQLLTISHNLFSLEAWYMETNYTQKIVPFVAFVSLQLFEGSILLSLHSFHLFFPPAEAPNFIPPHKQPTYH